MYAKFLLVFIAAVLTAQNQTDTLRIGTLENPISLISPYYDFAINKRFFIEQSYGKSLYYFKESEIISEDVESIKQEDSEFIIRLVPNSRFVVDDIIFTFNHYKSYYEKSNNQKYYFFSQIKNLKAIPNGFSFALEGNRIGLFNRIYLTYPILTQDDVDVIEASGSLAKPISSQYGQYQVNLAKDDKRITFSLKGNSTNQVNVVQILQYDEESNLFINARTDNIGFFKFTQVPEFYSNNSSMSQLTPKTINKNKNEVIVFGANNKEFAKDERQAFFKLINRQHLLSQYLGGNYEIANSIYRNDSKYHFSREAPAYNAIAARKELIKSGYRPNELAFLTKYGKNKKYRLFYPAKNAQFRQIANRIFVNFAEIDIFLEPYPVSYGELFERIKTNSYDFYLIDLKHNDEEYISMLKFISDTFLKKNRKFELHYKRLELISGENSVIPIVQRLQDVIQSEVSIMPLFTVAKYSLMLSKKYENAVKFFSKDNQPYFELNSLSKWRVNAQ